MLTPLQSELKALLLDPLWYLHGELRPMKVRSSVKKISPDDQIVKRRGRIYVINKKRPRNKQRQG